MGKYEFKKYWYYDFCKVFGSWPLLLYLRPKKIYLNEKVKEDAKKAVKGGVLLTYNHTGFMDGMKLNTCFFSRRHRLVADRTRYQNPRFGLFLKLILSIPIDKDAPSPATVREIVRTLKAGNAVDIFPEGQTNHTPEQLLPFKDGPVLFAYMAGVPIQPVCIAFRKHWWNRQRYYIGEPVYLQEAEWFHGKEDIHKATEYLQERMQELLDISLGK